MRHVVLLLAFLSGACGIAYEVFYARLLSAYLGDIFYVSAILFATFFLGIALGALYGYRFVRHLRYFEIGIGLYALGIVWITSALGFGITEGLLAIPLHEIASLSLSVFLILIIPALLIGFGVPLFALYIKQYQQNRAFSLTYALYNLGAALSVLLIEFVLIRTVGISASVSFIALINIVIGVALFLVPIPPQPEREPFANTLKTNPPLWLSLLMVSIASGVLQMVLLTLFYHTLGPFRESIALLIGATLIAITLAAIVIRVTTIRFKIVLLLAGVFSLLPFLFLDPAITAYSQFFTNQALADGSNTVIVLGRLLFAFVFAIPALIFFGMTIPSLVREHGFAMMRPALVVSAAGNALGYLLFIFVLHEWLSVPSLFITVSFIVLFAISTYQILTRPLFVFTSAVGIFIFASALLATYPSYTTQIGYRGLSDINFLTYFKEQDVAENTYKKFGNSARIIQFGDVKFLSLNGYVTLNFHDPIHGPELRESLVGTLPVLFSEDRTNAFVLGLGTGITGSALARTYDDVIIAEINPAMIQVAGDLAEFNDGVVDKENVTIDLQDGLITLLQDDTTYSAIVNTLTSPIYFSANKLWTKDFFELVNSRLTPDGVFVGWVDGRLGQSGVEAMDNTLREVFNECQYMYLDSAYMGFACSNSTLEYREPADEELHPSLSRAAAAREWPGAPRDIFDYTIMSLDAPKETTLTNTLDIPTLEFKYGAGSNEEAAAYFHRNIQMAFDEYSPAEKQRACDALHVVYPWQKCDF